MKPIKLNNRSRLASITHAETHTTDTYYASPGPLRSDPTTAASRRVWASRAIFVTFLLTVAGVLGYVSYHLLTDSEGRLAHGQFEGIAERALDAALATTLRRRLAAMSVATTVAHSFSDANIWPNASIPGFEAIASSVMTAAASNRTNFGVCTLVSPDQLAQFEDYFYNIAIGTINPNYPNTTGMRAFGGDEVLEKGIHGFDDKFQIYRETDGKVWWNSTYDVICPYTMHTAGHRILMYNAHSFEGLGRAIDEVISCANNRSKVTELNLNDCSIVTDMFQTYDGDGNSLGPNAFIVQPVYPANDPNALVAIGISGLIWAETLEDLFTADVNGVDLVLQTETQVNTYQIHGGVPSLLGEGDLHASKYSEHAISIDLYSPGLFSYTSAQYTLTIYPKDSFFEVYSTGNPQMATMVVVFSILFTALLFFTYDFFVRQEFHAKQAVLEAKRLYVRYVSHEVRTPLNTVCMGLTLLRDEISTSLKPLHLESKTEVEPLSMTKDGRDKAEATVQHLLSLTDEVLHNAEGAVDVLNDLLNYDKVERGKLSLELGIVRIWDLIAQAVNEFRVQAAAEKLHFVLDMGEIATDDTESHNKMIFAEGVEEKIVVGDPVKITQCVRNLVSNALKFTPEEGKIDLLYFIICLLLKQAF
jgi:signal transduction histidine kinase